MNNDWRRGSLHKDKQGIYTDYFHAVLVLEKLMGGGADRPWTLLPPRNPPHHDYVLYLGCNLLRTAHLARTLALILDNLGEDYIAVGGPAYCCGSIYDIHNDPDVASRTFERTTSSLIAAFSPRTLINWCPACERQIDRQLSGRGTLPYHVLHFSEFLRERLQQRTGELRPVPWRVGLHAHTGEGHADRDTQAVRAILALIPGLTLVDLPSHPELGYQCSRLECIAAVGEAAYYDLLDADFATARQQGVDCIADIYHGCHRELCKRAGGEIHIVNYATIVAMALGLQAPRDLYQQHAGEDYEALLAALGPQAEGMGVRRELLEQVLRAEFGTA